MVLRTNQFLIYHTQLHISSRAFGGYLTKENSAEFQLTEIWSQTSLRLRLLLFGRIQALMKGISFFNLSQRVFFLR